MAVEESNEIDLREDVDDLHVEHTTTPTGVLLAVKGEVDCLTAPRFWDELVAAIGTHASVELDMTGVSFMDSSGLGVLVDATRMCGEGQSLLISAASRQARRVLEVTGLTHLLADGAAATT